MSRRVAPGVAIPLQALIWNQAAGLYVFATIRTLDGAEVLGSPVLLGEFAPGVHSGDGPAMGISDVVIEYSAYTDLAGAVPAIDYLPFAEHVEADIRDLALEALIIAKLSGLDVNVIQAILETDSMTAEVEPTATQQGALEAPPETEGDVPGDGEASGTLETNPIEGET